MVWVVWLSLRRTKEQDKPIRFENSQIGQSLSNQIESDGRFEFESNLQALQVASKNCRRRLEYLPSLKTATPTWHRCSLRPPSWLISQPQSSVSRSLRQSSSPAERLRSHSPSASHSRPSLVSSSRRLASALPAAELPSSVLVAHTPSACKIHPQSTHRYALKILIQTK